MALAPSAPLYPIYTGNTQDTKNDIPGRTDVANAADYNIHDAELIAHQSKLVNHEGRIVSLESGLSGIKIYYVSDTPGGPTDRKLTFTNGALTSET